MNALLLKKTILIGVISCSTAQASAGIVLGGTRVLYNENVKEASIMVMNQSSQDIMVQSWIDPENIKINEGVPFVVTPPLSRLGGNKQQTLRIMYSGEPLPTDKESIFRLNVQEIPQKSKNQNSLQIAVRQRIKLFYRPSGIAGKPEDAPKMLEWRLVEKLGEHVVELRNPSSYYVSFSGVNLNYGASKYPIQLGMIAPKSNHRINIQSLNASKIKKLGSIDFTVINDYGGHDPYVSNLIQ